MLSLFLLRLFWHLNQFPADLNAVLKHIHSDVENHVCIRRAHASVIFPHFSPHYFLGVGGSEVFITSVGSELEIFSIQRYLHLP